MKSADEFADDIIWKSQSATAKGHALKLIGMIEKRDAEVRSATIQSCIAIVQHHNVNLMGGEAAKQSIIKALMTMVEGEK